MVGWSLVKEKVKDPNAAPKKAKKTEVALIEPNRARSMAIMLGNLTQHGKRPIEEIGQAILSMDEASLGGLDGIESILLNSPNQEEISMLQTFERDHTDEVDQLGVEGEALGSGVAALSGGGAPAWPPARCCVRRQPCRPSPSPTR